MFVNDYSAVKEEQAAYTPPEPTSSDDLSARLLRAQPVTGKCYVLTFSAKHSVTLPDMTPAEILPVIETWTRIYASHLSPNNPLAAVAAKLPLLQNPPSSEDEVSKPKDQLRYMQIFENKGAAMGCSNPHPHCQIWTTSTLPEEPAKEMVAMTKYRAENGGRHLLADYVKLELEKGERVVWQNDGFLIVCPWWAVWPFEVLVIAKRHVRALVDFTDDERLWFAQAVQEVTRRYDNLFECSFPYSKLPRRCVGIVRPLEPAANRWWGARFRYSSSSPRLHPGGGRQQLVPHALLSASAAFCHGAQVLGRIRAAGRASEGHYSRAGRHEASRAGRRALPQDVVFVITFRPGWFLCLDIPISNITVDSARIRHFKVMD